MPRPRNFSRFAGRSEADIFSDLGVLARRPGYAHVIAYLCYQNNVIGYKEKLTATDLLKQHASDRTIRSEITTLVGLHLQGERDLILPRPEDFQECVSRTHFLLEEMHHCLGMAMIQNVVPPSDGGTAKGLGAGSALREPIFYGGEAAYVFQYRDLAIDRYRTDEEWLVSNKGFDLDAAQRIVQAIGRIQPRKIFSTYREMMKRSPETWTTLPGHILSADEVGAECSVDVPQVSRFFEAFAFSGKNATFQSLSDFNEGNASPLIPVGDGTYLLFQSYNLMEALYESPFYWMLRDTGYRDRATSNRGAFTEKFSAKRLSRVFGEQNVHQNARIVNSKGVVEGEIDVLVEFGNRLIILQAKSKRLTIEARKGNDGALQEDFRKAVQHAYDQAYACATHLLEGQHKLISADNNPLVLRNSPSEIFPVCVVSDSYPALSFQARQFLKFRETSAVRAPFVMDLFFLDALTEMLETPLHLLSYLRQRAMYIERLSVTHELTALSYHLRNNLWLDNEFHYVALSEDVSVDLDLAMSVRRDGVPGARTPEGILTALVGTPLGHIIEQIEHMQDPDTLDMGFEFLVLSGETCRSLNDGLERLSEMVTTDGQTHDLSIGFQGIEGITFHCSARPAHEALDRLLFHCRIKKYSRRAKTWIGVCVDTKFNIRFGVNFDHDWEWSAEMDRLVAGLTSSN